MRTTEFRNEKGGSMLEYLFLAMLIMLVAIAGVANIGTVTNEGLDSEEMHQAFGDTTP